MMEANNSNNDKEMEQVMIRIWSIFDIVRKSGRYPSVIEQAEVVLVLLSMYKDGISPKDLFNEPSKVEESEGKYSIVKKNNAEEYKAFLQFLNLTSNELYIQFFEQLSLELNKCENRFFTNNYAEIFDRVIYQLSVSQARLNGEFIQPVELTRFICGLTELKERAKVYNPFAGLASFGVFIKASSSYFAQELNQYNWAMGTLRLKAYQRINNVNFLCQDSILNWPDKYEKFDLIVSNPPFGLRLNSIYNKIEPDIRSVEHFLFEKGINSLTDDGKLIALLPQGFLFRVQEQKIRQFLIDKDLIDTVVSLPSGLLSGTGISLSILFVNKNKKNAGKVRLVIADKFVTSNNSGAKKLNDFDLINFLNSNHPDDDVIRIVDNDEIKSNDYNLSVGRYFYKEIEGVNLRKLLIPIPNERVTLPKTGKFIRIRDLKDDKTDSTLDLSLLEETELQQSGISVVSESCLLLAMRWRSLKPTYFDFNDKPVYRNQDIAAFKIDETIVDKAYLINELHADYVQNQLISLQKGATIPFISKDDLLKIVIKLPSIVEQKAKVQGLSELSEKIKLLQVERNALAHGSSIKQFNEFASLKHTLGRPRQNILGWTKNMIRFFESNNEVLKTLDTEFKDFYEKGIVEALYEIRNDINFMTDVLEKGEHGLVLSEYELQSISLADINGIVSSLSNNGYNFRIKKLLLKGERQKEKGIYGNSMLLRTLFDNLLTNANKHGFVENSPSNEVVIEMLDLGDNLTIEVKNNGKPFPKNFDRDKFIAKYSTQDTSAGSGLGGYDIQRIAEYFSNPKWELTLNNDPFYPVKFKFIFPIKLID